MNKSHLQKLIVTGKLTLPVTVILSILIWNIKTYNLFPLFIYTLVGYLLIIINNQFNIIKIRSTIQSVLFLSLCAIYLPIHNYEISLCGEVILISSILFVFLSSLHLPNTNFFYASLLLCSASLIEPIYVAFIVPLILSSIFLRQLTHKSFVAILLGIIMPVWCLLSWYLYKGLSFGIIFNQFKKIELFNFEAIKLTDYIFILLIIYIYTYSLVGYLNSKFKSKSQTKNYINILNTFFISTILIILLAPSLRDKIIPISIFSVSLLGGHYFSNTMNKTSNINLIVTLLLIVTIFSLNLWMY